MLRPLVAGSAVALVAAVAAGPATRAASPELDPAFGDGGMTVVGGGTASLYPYDLAREPDGSVVAVGYGYAGNPYSDAAVLRLGSDGRPDPSSPVRLLNAGGIDRGDAVTVQPDGKIVVAGYTSVGDNVAVWRLLPSGVPDPSFSGDGFTSLDSGGNEEAFDVAVAADGRILLAGKTTSATGQRGMIVYRLTADGALDPTFDVDGAVRLGTSYGYATAVAVQSDGKVLVTGYDSSSTTLTVYRLTVTGALDATFDFDGIATVPSTYPEGFALALQPGGGVLVAAHVYNGVDYDVVIARLTPSGSVDASFGSVSGVHVDLGGDEELTSLTLLPSGKIAGAGSTDAGDDGLVVVLGADGTPDAAFGPRGVRRVGVGSEELYGVTAQPDGKLLVLGNDGGSVTKAVVYRLVGDYSAPAPPPPAASCQGRPATLLGTSGDDRLKGTHKADVVVALGGNDVVKGLGGNDVVCAGDGDDKVLGGPGRDRLYGEAGRDHLVGGSGKDRLVGGPDRDAISQ